MRNQKVVAVEPWRVELQAEDLEAGALKPRELLVRKRLTLISAGTELACISGNEYWFKLPGVPGYAAVSEVVDKGANVSGFEVGDIVFHHGKHSLYEVLSLGQGIGAGPGSGPLVLKVPDGLDLLQAIFARMATVAMTALRVSRIELGDCVAVTGLGLVGNLAAQLARLQGGKVIGVDISQGRIELARSCGIERLVWAGEHDVIERVKALSDGLGVSTLIEATGLSQVLVDSLPFVARYGEVILLGSPRAPYQSDVTDLLNYVHLLPKGSLTFHGAHEWRYPVKPDPFVKHSIERNTQIALDLIRRGELRVEPLLSHVFDPRDAQQAYDGLRSKRDTYCGVVFDWTKISM